MGQVPTGIHYRAVLVSSIIALSGCGGGGDGGGTGPMGNQPTNNSGNPSNLIPTTNAAGVAVVTNKPDKGAIGINEGDAIIVTFNTDIDPATLSTTTFIVRDEMSHMRIPGTVSYDPATKTATFKPQTPLNQNGHYLVTLSQGIKNTAGAALAADYTWDFEVRGQPISQTVMLYPAKDLTNVSVKSIVRIDFNEPMDGSTINASTFSLAPDNGLAVEGAVSTSDQPFHQGGQISLFRPKAELAANTRYTAKLTQGVKTLVGVPLDQDLTWSFTTAAARTATIQYGTSMEDIANALAIDNDGNTFIVGSTDKAEALVRNPNTPTTPPGNVDVDMLLLSFDANGNKRWHKQPGSNAPDNAVKALVDSSGDVIIVGSTDGQLGTDTAVGNSDIVVMKVSGATGEPLWTRQFGSSEHDVPRDAIIDSTGNIFITGFTVGALPGQTAVGEHDVLAIKLAADGAPVWGVQFGSNKDEIGEAIALDDKNNLFIAGMTTGSFSGQQLKGQQDAFLTKLNADNGSLAATQFIDFNNRDEFATSLAINSSGIFVGGNTSLVMQGGGFGPELGDQDPFISAFNLAGDKSLWTRQWKTATVDSIVNLTTDFSRDLYVTGIVVEEAPNPPPSGGGPGTPTPPPTGGGMTPSPGGGPGGGMPPPPGTGGGMTPGGGPGGGIAMFTNTFISKVSPIDGKDIWTNKLIADEHGHIIAEALTADNKGNVYLGGTVHGDMGVDGNISAGAGDVFIVKYTADKGDKL